MTSAHELDRRHTLGLLGAAAAGVAAGVPSAAFGAGAPIDSNLAAAVDRLTSGQTWRRLLDVLAKTEPLMRGHPTVTNELAKAEAGRFMLRVLESARLTQMEQIDPAYPQLIRIFNTYLNYGDCNPDSVYMHAAVSDKYAYRITGPRGSARILDVQCMEGDFIDGTQRGRAFLSDIEAGPDGKVEVILSATPQPGNWVKIDPEVRWIYVRQYYYDWDNEQPADLVIERIGATYPPPPVNAAEIATRLDRIVEMLESWTVHVIDDVIGRHYRLPADQLFWMLSKSAMAQNHYGNGRYELEPGQAMILELKEPKAAYWNVVLLNAFGESTRWDARQTTLNGHQAEVDPDGVVRFVISPSDPGVPNWLDTEGRLSGTYTVRVLRPEADPVVTTKLVALGDVRATVHPATPLVTPEARSEAVRRRMLGAMRRFRQ